MYVYELRRFKVTIISNSIDKLQNVIGLFQLKISLSYYKAIFISSFLSQGFVVWQKLCPDSIGLFSYRTRQLRNSEHMKRAEISISTPISNFLRSKCSVIIAISQYRRLDAQYLSGGRVYFAKLNSILWQTCPVQITWDHLEEICNYRARAAYPKSGERGIWFILAAKYWISPPCWLSRRPLCRANSLIPTRHLAIVFKEDRDVDSRIRYSK